MEIIRTVIGAEAPAEGALEAALEHGDRHDGHDHVGGPDGEVGVL